MPMEKMPTAFPRSFGRNMSAMRELANGVHMDCATACTTRSNATCQYALPYATPNVAADHTPVAAVSSPTRWYLSPSGAMTRANTAKQTPNTGPTNAWKAMPDDPPLKCSAAAMGDAATPNKNRCAWLTVYTNSRTSSAHHRRHGAMPWEPTKSQHPIPAEEMRKRQTETDGQCHTDNKPAH